MVMCMGGGRPWEVASRASSRARGRTPKLSINHVQGSLSLSIIIHKRDTGSSAPLRHRVVRKAHATLFSRVPVSICGESMVSPCSAVNRFPQCKPTPESATRCCALDLKGRPVRPSSPPSAVAGLTVVVRKNGRPLPISDVYYIKPMLLPHEGWPMAVGNCSRLRGSAPSRKNRTAVRPTLALAHLREFRKSGAATQGDMSGNR